jgi:hypothetical protein
LMVRGQEALDRLFPRLVLLEYSQDPLLTALISTGLLRFVNASDITFQFCASISKFLSHETEKILPLLSTVVLNVYQYLSILHHSVFLVRSADLGSQTTPESCTKYMYKGSSEKNQCDTLHSGCPRLANFDTSPSSRIHTPGHQLHVTTRLSLHYALTFSTCKHEEEGTIRARIKFNKRPQQIETGLPISKIITSIVG